MKSHLYYLMIIVTSLTAQFSKVKEDTITTGKWNEYNPSFARRTFYNPPSFEWIVFERQTDDSSFIVIKKYSKITGAWDSSEVIISRSTKNELQKYPDIGSKENYSIIAWQKKTGTNWNLFYSTYSQASQIWSSPLALTNDTLDNMNVRIQSLYPDSQFVFAWQNKNVIRLNKYPLTSVGVNDTIAISNYDSTEFDLGIERNMSQGAILYTIKTSTKYTSIVSLNFTYDPKISVKGSDTVQYFTIKLHPRFVHSYSSRQKIVFEIEGTLSIAHDIYLYDINPSFGSYQPIRITNSANNYTTYKNARAYYNPVVTDKIEINQNTTPYNHVIVCESISMNDTTNNTSVIIIQQGSTDSITSIGYNRNPIVGSNPYYSLVQNKQVIPVVWESNRSGKNHLYGKTAVAMTIDGVEKNKQSMPRFALLQNYPNPFNPTTNIEYSLPEPSNVNITVFDFLGREVALLIHEYHSAGIYSATFDASKLASGVYFYKITAGRFSTTKKMLLMK